MPLPNARPALTPATLVSTSSAPLAGGPSATGLSRVVCAWMLATGCGVALAQPAGPSAVTANSPSAPAPLVALPELQLQPYLGTWYQVALFPNRFQRQCVSDTTATYRLKDNGRLEVRNRCRQADGSLDEAVGEARAVRPVEQGVLRPAQLRVSFLPSWLRWLPVGEGDYWVIQRPEDGRYAVISEPTRRYLWVLSRTPRLLPDDESAIRSRLQAQGFDLAAWTAHPQGPTAAAGTAAPR